MEKITTAFTHSGIFHADDVFSAALLTYLYPNIEIHRGFKVDQNFKGIVFDIGFGEFDHHQENSPIRENGVPYAAFGLLWQKFGTQILNSEEAEKFDKNFIQQLDLSDNTGEPNILSGIISSFNPVWNSTKTSDEAFKEAKNFALEILKKKFEHILSYENCDKLISEYIEKSSSNYVLLPYFIPWKKALCETEKLFVIYPSKRGGYNAQAVPVNTETTELRCPFPNEWRNKTPDELFEITKIKGINFCHASGFLISTETKEVAITACEKVANMQI